MDKVIDSILEYAQKKTEQLSFMDQQMVYDYLADKFKDMFYDALKNDYLDENIEETYE